MEAIDVALYIMYVGGFVVGVWLAPAVRRAWRR